MTEPDVAHATAEDEQGELDALLAWTAEGEQEEQHALLAWTAEGEQEEQNALLAWTAEDEQEQQNALLAWLAQDVDPGPAAEAATAASPLPATMQECMARHHRQNYN